MAVPTPFRVWFDAECVRRGFHPKQRKSWLVRESGCSYATVSKAIRGDYVGTHAARRLSEATGLVVSEVAILQLAKRKAS